MASYEEATRCPKCGNTGELVSKHPAGTDLPRGTMAHVLMCKTELCRWYNTTWLVQVNPDNTVPDAKTVGRQKQFVDAPIDTVALEQAWEKELEAQRKGGAETR